jgi:light-regulated signal transduction histidine kinase (bacteriophytochrome)
VELLNKFYQKVKLNQQLLQEVSNLTRRSEALAQKNREKKELFEVFRESNNTLYERLHHYEKKIKELKRNQEQNVEQRQQTFVDNFVQGFRNSLESVSALALSGESEQDRLAVLRHDFLTMEQPGPSTLQLIDLNKLLEAVVLKLHRRYRILNRVRFNMDRVPEVLSHPDKISAAFSQVIRAMLLNLAVRQQDLTISAEHVAKAVTIRLTIPGTLYNQEESSRLFDPFYRTPGDPDEEMIGLFRARYLLAMCNGEIYFDQAKGPVSRFVIRIPE